MITTLNEFYHNKFLKNLILNEQKLSDKQIAYQELMFFGLAKFGVETPADLSNDQKSEFFTWIGDNWDKDKGDVKDEKIKEQIKKAKEKGLINDPKEIAKTIGNDDDAEDEKDEIAKQKAKEFEKELEN